MTSNAFLPVEWSEPDLTDDDLDRRLAAVKRQAEELTPVHDDHDLEDAVEDAAERIVRPVIQERRTGRGGRRPPGTSCPPSIPPDIRGE